jgi:hypothetical protein
MESITQKLSAVKAEGRNTKFAFNLKKQKEKLAIKNSCKRELYFLMLVPGEYYSFFTHCWMKDEIEVLVL